MKSKAEEEEKKENKKKKGKEETDKESCSILCQGLRLLE